MKLHGKVSPETKYRVKIYYKSKNRVEKVSSIICHPPAKWCHCVLRSPRFLLEAQLAQPERNNLARAFYDGSILPPSWLRGLSQPTCPEKKRNKSAAVSGGLHASLKSCLEEYWRLSEAAEVIPFTWNSVVVASSMRSLFSTISKKGQFSHPCS